MILTDAERARFIEWLKNEADTDAALAKQAERLGLMGGSAAKKLRLSAVACVHVMKLLESIESQTLGEDDVGTTSGAPIGADGGGSGGGPNHAD